MAKKAKQRADHRADNRGGAWAGIPHCVLDSLAYRHLSLWGRAVLLEIVREMNGYNNGEIGISQRQLADRLRTTNFRSIGKAIAELMTHNLIDITVEGQWKQRKARQYRLTFVNTGGPGHYRPASNEYREWKPNPFSSDDNASAESPVLADTSSADTPIAADTGSAVANGKLAKMPIHAADTVSSLISKPYQGPETEGEKHTLLDPQNTAGRFSAKGDAA